MYYKECIVRWSAPHRDSDQSFRENRRNLSEVLRDKYELAMLA